MTSKSKGRYKRGLGDNICISTHVYAVKLQSYRHSLYVGPFHTDVVFDFSKKRPGRRKRRKA